jgi:glycosyltransferase involved in cell wall biosynthesis
MKKLRIAFVTRPEHSVPPRGYGSIGRIVEPLIRILSRRGHEVTLYTVKAAAVPARIEHLACGPVSEEDFRRLHGGFATARPFEWLRYSYTALARLSGPGERYDLVHNHDDPFFFMLARGARVPMLTTIHGSSACHVYELHPEKSFSVVSQWQRRSLHPAMNVLGTVYNGLDVERFPYVAAKNGALAYVGRVMASKGAEIAIRVARSKRSRGLVIAGNVPDHNEAYFRERIAPHLDRDLSVPGRATERTEFLENFPNYHGVGEIVYLGEVTTAERNVILSNASCVLFPSTANEAFGLVPAEANACGTPVVAFRSGAVPEVVRHGETGILVDTVEEMTQALEPIARIRPRDCRRWVQESFGVETMADGYESIYRKALSS